MHVGSPENKMFDPVEEDKADDHPVVDALGDRLEDLRWASAQAYARAQARNLTASDFEGQEESGKGGFTTGDVNRIAAEVFGP
jgi:hypothetical protein